MNDKDLAELKRSRPAGPGWEWYKANADGTDFLWFLNDEKQHCVCFIGLFEGKWFADVMDDDKAHLYKVQFETKEAMSKWAREFAALKVRRTLQIGHKYYARPIETIKSLPGCWDKFKIGVFRRNEDGDELIGDYNRNYEFLDTFHWFTKDGKDYALYSKEYTATRIMELPSCKDLGGEEPEGHGFCPVEFYVPSYVDRAIIDKDPKFDGTKYRIYEPTIQEIADKDGSKALTGLVHDPYGFVAGCVWGDDTSWKIQHLDLSAADKGILKRDDRFGYIELPGHMILRDAIDMGDGECNIRIAHDDWFDPKTGKKSE